MVTNVKRLTRTITNKSESFVYSIYIYFGCSNCVSLILLIQCTYPDPATPICIDKIVLEFIMLKIDKNATIHSK